jgi:hypothetical protein
MAPYGAFAIDIIFAVIGERCVKIEHQVLTVPYPLAERPSPGALSGIFHPVEIRLNRGEPSPYYRYKKSMDRNVWLMDEIIV